MNDLYLIEPYNAYQKPPKKKHWMEIAEEEELFNRMIQEQQMLHYQNPKKSTKDSSTFLLLKDEGNSPQTAVASGVGGGGVPTDYSFFNTNIILNFTSSVRSGSHPLTVNFTNLTTGDLKYINYNWNFGDLTGSTATNPTHIYYNSGSYGVALTGSSQGNASIISYLYSGSYMTVG
jgi:hypothetical protein